MTDYEFSLKSVAPVRVASIRQVLGKYPDIGPLFGEVVGFIQQSGLSMAGPAIAIWYDPEYRETDVDGEAACPVTSEGPESERVRVYELPAIESAATTWHRGDYANLPQAYDALFQWIRTQGYIPCGPIREVYVEMDPSAGPETYLTEIQAPVRVSV